MSPRIKTAGVFVLLPLVVAAAYGSARLSRGPAGVAGAGTQLQSPTATETAETVAPGILFFSADQTEVDPGGTLTLRWATSGTSQTVIKILRMDQHFAFPTPIPVPAAGELAYHVPEDLYVGQHFSLTARGAAGGGAIAELDVKARCLNSWWVQPPPSADCPRPAGPATITEQQFEHGTLLYVRQGAFEPDFVLGYSYDTRGQAWPKWWGWERVQAGQARPTVEPPPAGLYAPGPTTAPGWAGPRSSLGWATGPETTFIGTMQLYGTRYTWYYIQAADGGVWMIPPEGGRWAHWEPAR